jgi:hypothetical protein
MRLKAATPDTPFINLHRIMFECDCGRSTDQVVADPE